VRFLAIPLVAFALSCASRPGVHRAPTGNFQPLEVGLEWTYDLGGRVQTRRVVGVEHVGRFECAVVESSTDDSVHRYWLRWDREGLKLHKAVEDKKIFEYEDPLLLIHRLAAPSATWSFEERHGPLALDVDAAYEADDDITVGDRILRCARIHYVKRAGGRVALDQTCWYAKDVGLVRMAISLAGDAGFDKWILQLTSWNFTAD